MPADAGRGAQQEGVRGFLRGRWLPLAVGALWAGLVCVAWLASRGRGADVTTCVFKRMTGAPCATCGGTRVLSLILQGRIGEAAALNPLVSVLLLGMPLMVAAWWWLARRRGTPIIRTARGWGLAAAGVVVVVGVNWVYVLLTQG